MPVAGLVNLPRRPPPRRYQSGGYVRRLQAGGPSGPGGGVSISEPSSATPFGVPYYGANPASDPTNLEAVPAKFTDMAGVGAGFPMVSTQTSDAIPGGGFWSAGALRQAQAALGMASTPQAGPGTATPRGQATLSPAGLAFLNTQLPPAFGSYQDFMPSTDNWRILPPPYNTPNYMMRNGHIIDRTIAKMGVPASGAFVGNLADNSNTGVIFGRGGPGKGYPVSMGSSTQRAYYWPGQIEQPEYEGGTGTYWTGGYIY
jgi:hypothetical protein